MDKNSHEYNIFQIQKDQTLLSSNLDPQHIHVSKFL
jgi:hypothetical protein